MLPGFRAILSHILVDGKIEIDKVFITLFASRVVPLLVQ